MSKDAPENRPSATRTAGPRIDTLAIHAGQEPDPTTGAIMTPVYLTATYVQESPGVHKGYEYSRTGNPTRTALESCIAALEGGRHGLCFSSGTGASLTVLHLLKSGDHVVAGDDLYGGTIRLFDRVLADHGLSFSYVDLTDASRLEAAITPRTRMVFIETPTNPLLKMIDIKAVAEVTRRRGLLLVVDNTFMTPYFQRPLELGADLVVHSTTKYLNGHSDVVGGAVVGSDDEVMNRLRYLQNAIGATPGAMDSFLVLRGLKTLGVRMPRHADNARRVVSYLKSRREVARVIWPGDETHPQFELARRQMRGPGGMVTFVLGGPSGDALLEKARKWSASTRLFACAESLGGVESLVDHPAIMTHAAVPREQREARGITDGLIRLSVGIEDPDDLLADLEQAFSAI
jgi:cystathionine gamma-lyase